MKLSIITPFFCSSVDSYLYSRGLWYIEEMGRVINKIEGLEVLLVDYGSPSLISKKIDNECARMGLRYANLSSGHLPFSAGRCRNHGVQIAKGEYVLFQDVDLHGTLKIYDAIIDKTKQADRFYNEMEMIPCFYLTEQASNEYLRFDESQKLDRLYNAYLSNDATMIKMVAPATSCILVNRFFYLSSGGVREEFFGHGYEDFELINRISYYSKKYYRSHDYYSHDHRYDSIDYKGYRTYYSMFGRQNLAEKIYLVHLYHDAAKDFGYAKSSARNRKIFENCLLSFDKSLDAPPALEDKNSNCINLFIGSRDSIPYKSLRHVIPFFGKSIFRHETDFKNESEFKELLESNEVIRVFFLNPYGNDVRLNLYKYCKSESINVIVFDRGALPDSWFFDDKGFNAESKSYSPSMWDKPLDEGRLYKVENYISNLCTSDVTLEENGERIGSYELKKRLGILDKKVLFVPLQRPADTVIKYFSGNVQGVEDFASKVSMITTMLASDWVVLVKQHPLENYELSVPGAIVVDSKTHVYDLLDSSDAVALINSGVGVLALAFGKPVYCFGESFYCHNGLATNVANVDELVGHLKFLKKPNRETVLRFIDYLIEDFYSFAKTDYMIVKNDDGSSRNVAVDLRIYQLIIPGDKKINFNVRDQPYGTSSPVYDYFRSYFLKSKKPPPKKSDVPVKKVENTLVANIIQNAPDLPGGMVVAESLKVRSSGGFYKKTRKLFLNPRAFFVDALKK